MYFGETLPDAGYMADTRGIHRNTKEYNCIPGALTLIRILPQDTHTIRPEYTGIHTEYIDAILYSCVFRPISAQACAGAWLAPPLVLG